MIQITADIKKNDYSNFKLQIHKFFLLCHYKAKGWLHNVVSAE